MPISAPPAGIAPIGKPMSVPRIQAGKERRQSASVIHSEPRTGSTVSAARDPRCRRDVERLADGEERDRDRRHLDAVEESRNAEREPRLSAL